MALLGDRESRLLIDGKLVAGSGGTFPTVNPATEEMLGVAADATVDDMGLAPSGLPVAPSTTPTGRPTSSCACAASGSCSRRCAITRTNCANLPSPRWALLGC